MITFLSRVRVSVSYKIRQNDFDAIFFQNSSERYVLGAKYFAVKTLSKLFV